jgi:hypothetical protein
VDDAVAVQQRHAARNFRCYKSHSQSQITLIATSDQIATAVKQAARAAEPAEKHAYEKLTC